MKASSFFSEMFHFFLCVTYFLAFQLTPQKKQKYRLLLGCSHQVLLENHLYFFYFGCFDEKRHQFLQERFQKRGFRIPVNTCLVFFDLLHELAKLLLRRQTKVSDIEKLRIVHLGEGKLKGKEGETIFLIKL